MSRYNLAREEVINIPISREYKVFIPDLPKKYNTGSSNTKAFVEISSLEGLYNHFLSPDDVLLTGQDEVAYKVVYNSLHYLIMQGHKLLIRFHDTSTDDLDDLEKDPDTEATILPDLYEYRHILFLYAPLKDDNSNTYTVATNYLNKINGVHKDYYKEVVFYTDIFNCKGIADDEDWATELQGEIRGLISKTPTEREEALATLISIKKLPLHTSQVFYNYYVEGELTLPASVIALSEAIKNIRLNVPYKAVAGHKVKIGSQDATALFKLSKLELDILRELNINPIEDKRNVGVILSAQNTLDKAFPQRRINIVSTLFWLKDYVSEFAEQYRFEPNAQSTWDSIEIKLTNFFMKLVELKVVKAFGIDCGVGKSMTKQDEVSGILRINIIYKPISVIDEIVLDVRITTEDVNVSYDFNLGGSL